MGHMNFKRVLHRINEELYSTMSVTRVLGVKAGWASLLGKIDIQLMVHNGRIERSRYKRHLLRKHEVMNRYFAKTCPMSEECKNIVVPQSDERNKDCIWVCWWQGLENAPKIVRECVESIKRHAGSHKVIVITDENYKEYVHFPTWLEDKYERGILTKTHMSDILRLMLLANWGGVWLDSTFYCNGDLEEYFTMPVWSIKRPDYRHVSVACGYFANYSFGCGYENRKIFAKLAAYVLQYWKTHDYMVDYLFLDYLIVQAQLQDKEIKNAFSQISPNNRNCDELIKILNLPFDEKKWAEIKKETILFKLTWKVEYPIEQNGKETFYGKLLKGTLR